MDVSPKSTQLEGRGPAGTGDKPQHWHQGDANGGPQETAPLTCWRGFTEHLRMWRDWNFPVGAGRIAKWPRWAPKREGQGRRHLYTHVHSSSTPKSTKVGPLPDRWREVQDGMARHSTGGGVTRCPVDGCEAQQREQSRKTARREAPCVCSGQQGRAQRDRKWSVVSGAGGGPSAGVC